MTAATSTKAPTGPGWRGRVGKALPYILLAPGLLFLILFFVIPAIQMFTYSISTGSVEEGFTITWTLDAYREGLETFGRQFLNSIIYGGIATILCLVIGFPVAYMIAFRGGRYKNLILFLVIAPFFTSFLIRTISWKILLGDEGPVLGPLKHTLGILPGTFSLLGDARGPGGRDHLQLPAVHDPAAVRGAREDRLPAHRGGRGPVREPGRRLPAGHVPAGAAGRLRRLAADVHPGDGRLHQRRAAGQPAAPA